MRLTYISQLAPPAVARTDLQRSLEKIAATRKFTSLDAIIFIAFLLNFVLTYTIGRSVSWWTPAPIELFMTAYLLVFLPGNRIIRSLLGRLLAIGLIAGFCELFTDFSGERVVHSLYYPSTQPMLWASPFYMPLSWLVVLTPLAYLAWRLNALVGWRLATFICGFLGAIEIPLFEEIAYYAGWWHYAPVTITLGHTPGYVMLFEGLVIAALPLLCNGIERRVWWQVGLLGIIIGAWMPVCALTAWLLIGR